VKQRDESFERQRSTTGRVRTVVRQNVWLNEYVWPLGEGVSLIIATDGGSHITHITARIIGVNEDQGDVQL
jgi:hypothetical protein